MLRISFTRVADNAPEAVDASDTHTKNNEIDAFKANGQHYHLKPQGHPVDIMADRVSRLSGDWGIRFRAEGFTAPDRLLEGVL